MAIFACALAVRCAYVANVHQGAHFPDERCYWRVAENFREGRGLALDTNRQVVRAPVYPLVLAASQALFGDDVRPLRLVQALIGAATCVLLYYFGRSVFGRLAGVCAAGLATIYPFFVFYTAYALSETIFIALLVAYMMLVWIVRERQSWPAALAAGVVLGAAVLTRPSSLLLFFLTVPLTFKGHVPLRRQAGRVVLLTAAFALAMAPWVVRNYRVTGKFVPTTLQVGASLYESNSPQADGGPAMDRIAWPAEAERMCEYDRDRYLLRKSIEFIRSEPARFGRLCLHRARRFWNVVPNYSGYRGFVYAAASFASYVPVLLLAVVGLVLSLKRPVVAVLLAMPVAYFAALHSVFVGSTRYRTPIMPMLMLFAGHAIAANYDLRRARGVRPIRKEQMAAWAAVVLSALTLAVVAWHVGIERGELKQHICRAMSERVGGEASIQNIAVDPWAGLEVQGLSFPVMVPGAYPAQVRIQRMLLKPRLSHLMNRNIVIDVVNGDGLALLVRLRPNSKVHVPDAIAFVAELFGSLGRPAVGLTGSLRIVEERRTLADMSDWRVSMFPAELSGTVYTLQSSWNDRLLGPCTLKGTLDVAGPHLRITMTRRGIRLDERLASALPPQAQSAWRAAGITRGECDLSVTVTYEEGKDKDICVSAALDVRDTDFTYEEFPYPVRGASGRIECAKGSMKLTGLRGRAGPATVHLRDAQLQWPPPPGAMLTIEAMDMAFDDPLLACLPGDYQEVWRSFAPKGRGNATVLLEWRPEESTPFVASTRAELRGAEMTYEDFPLTITDVTGEITFLEDRADLRDLKGRFGGGWLRVDKTTIYYDAKPAFDLPIECHGLPLNSAFRAALDSELQALWDDLHPEGQASGLYRLMKPVGKDAAYEHHVRLAADRNELHYGQVGIPLAEVSGAVTCSADYRASLRLHAKSEGAPVSLTGTIGDADASLHFQGVGLPLSPALFKHASERVQQWAKQVRPSGRVDVDALVRFHSADKPPAVSGTLKLRDCAADVAVGLQGCTGTVTFEGSVASAPDRTLAGQAHMDTLRVRDYQVLGLEFRFKESKGAIAVSDLRAAMLGGSFSGRLRIDEGDATSPPRFGGELAAKGFRVEQIVQEKGKRRYKNLAGALAATLEFEGAADSEEEFEAGGTVAVTEGKLGELPLLLGLISLVKLGPFDSAAFTSADLAYRVRSRTAMFTKADLMGPVLSLYGVGVVNEDKTLYFKFRPELGKDGAHNGLASKVLNAAKEMLFPVLLQGSYDAPSWKLIPLLDVTRVVRGLVGAPPKRLPLRDPGKPDTPAPKK